MLSSQRGGERGADERRRERGHSRRESERERRRREGEGEGEGEGDEKRRRGNGEGWPRKRREGDGVCGWPSALLQRIPSRNRRRTMMPAGAKAARAHLQLVKVAH